MFHVRGCTTCILLYSIVFYFSLSFVWNFNIWHWWRMLNFSFIFTARYHGKATNKTHSRKKHCSHRNNPRTTWTEWTVRRRLAIAFFARLFSQSMNQKPSKKRLHYQISVGSDSGVPRWWLLLSLTLLLIITRATIFVLTDQSVNSCYATISTPPSDLTAPLPLLGAFNELFTSRLNIDKFCVNLRT